MKFVSYLIACVALAWAVPCFVLAQDGSIADHEVLFTLVSGSEITLKESSLDLLGQNGWGSSIVLEEGPENGTLEDFEGREIWKIYRPNPGFFGRDTLTYSVGDSFYRAWLYVSPAKVPVAGRWPTSDCTSALDEKEGSCPAGDEAGVGAELGWFDALEETFHLCNWDRDVVRDCRELPLPDDGNYQSWTPFTVDQTGDGWHELALRSPMTGETRVFRIVSPEPNDPESLVLIDTWAVGGPGDLPVAGSWHGNLVSELGLYRFDSQSQAGSLLLEYGGETLTHDLGSNVSRPWPLAGDWLQQGQDWIGVFDFEAWGLWMAPAGGSGPVEFETTLPYGQQTWVPAAGRWSHGGVSMLAMLNVGSLQPIFHVYRFMPGERGPLPLEVTVDPSGPVASEED